MKIVTVSVHRKRDRLVIYWHALVALNSCTAEIELLKLNKNNYHSSTEGSNPDSYNIPPHFPKKKIIPRICIYKKKKKKKFENDPKKLLQMANTHTPQPPTSP